jgi:hypothetical protein
MALLSVAGYLTVVATPASAAPPQTAGSDVPVWSTGWSWTYNQVDTINDPGTGYFQIDESVTYTVTGQAMHNGYNTYVESINGTVTGGTGTASGQTLSSIKGTVTGTQWQQTSNLALVEQDQTQAISGTAAGLVTVTINFQANQVSTPSWVNEDFRLHSGDTWLENTSIADTGVVSYNAGSFGSGTSPINSVQTINTTATDTATTANQTIASNIPVDQVAFNDTTNNARDTQAWSNTYHNIVADDFETGVPGGGACTSAATVSCAELTKNLASVSTPAPSLTVSEAVVPTPTACGGAPVTVSGNLSTGASGVPVTVTLDEQSLNPGQSVIKSATSGAAGAYTASFTAPNTPDGLQKGGIGGSFAIFVSGGGANNVSTLEVLPQDCTTTAYTGDTSGPPGSSANLSALVTDVATGLPVTGAVVTFSLTGQVGTTTGTTGTNGVATATLTVVGPPRAATVSASYAGGPADAASSASSAFQVTFDATSTSLTPSEPTATVGDNVTFTSQVSKFGPSIAAAPTGTVTFTVDAAPLGSPVTISPAGVATSAGDSAMAIGTHTVVATYSGDGNYAGSTQSILFVVHKVLTPSSTTLTAVPGTSVFGQSVTLTATVVSTGGSPTGSVEFLNGTTNLGVVALPASGPDQASLAIGNLPTGTDTLTADYLGDGSVNFAPSNSPPVQETVNPDATTTTITPSNASPVVGQGVTFQIAVGANAPGSGAPGGTVTLSIDGSPVGGAQTLSGGIASVSVASLNAGSHTVSAQYSGDPNFVASNASITEAVTQAQTSTVVISSANPSIQGQAVTFTATVTAQAPGAGTPTGLVTFFNNGTSIGSASLATSGGQDQASIGLANLPLGSGQVITATYAGDANFVTSTTTAAQSVTQNVVPAPPVFDTATALTASTNPSTYGQSVTFNAVISAVAPGGTPTGTVQFSIDGTNLGSPVSLDATGTAVSPAVSSLTAGGHTIIAAYSGDLSSPTEGFGASGQVLSQSVKQSATAVAVTSSANPAVYGQSLTFGANLTAVAPGMGTPAGSVQFVLNGNNLGNPVTVSGGSASVVQSQPLNPGNYTVSVITSGDPNFSGTTGSTTFVVSLVGTASTLTVQPNPVVYGNAVTFTDTVVPTAGPGTPPAGIVQFFDGTTLLGQSALATSSGAQRATFSISTLHGGVHSITAVYQGNPFYAGSTSAPVQLTVNKAPTSIVGTAFINVAILPSYRVLSATLTVTSTGAPIAGQVINFTAGGTPLCTAITNASGKAVCLYLGPVLPVVLALGYQLTFAATTDYGTSTNNAGIIG